MCEGVCQGHVRISAISFQIWQRTDSGFDLQKGASPPFWGEIIVCLRHKIKGGFSVSLGGRAFAPWLLSCVLVRTSAERCIS